MDVSTPAQRLAVLRWVTAGLTRSVGVPVDAAMAATATAMVRTHGLLLDGGCLGPLGTAAANFEEAVCDLMQSEQESEVSIGAQLLGLCLTDGRPAWFAGCLLDWGQKLTAVLAKGPPGGQHSAARSLACLFRRVKELEEVQGVTRDGLTVLGRTMPSAVSILKSSNRREAREAVWELFGAALAAMPRSLKPHLNAVEEAAVSALFVFEGKAHLLAMGCLAQLPNVTAAAADWQASMDRCLLACHWLLDEMASLSLTGGNAGKDSIREAALSLLGTPPGWEDDWRNRLDKVRHATAVQAALFGRLLGLMECLLSGPCSVPVVIPTSSLLLLAARVLGINSRNFPESKEAVQFVSRLLPNMQMSLFSLLRRMITQAGPAMLPSIGQLSRLLRDQLRVLTAMEDSADMGTPSTVREALYRCAASLLATGGPAAARRLVDTALPACRLELYGTGRQLAPGPPPKKQKVSKGARNVVAGDGQAEAVESCLLEGFMAARSIAAQVEATRVLQGLLEAGGAALPPTQRLEIDTIIAHLAAAARSASDSAMRGKCCDWPGLKQLQLAANKALLASIQCPAPHRPLFLSQAVETFKRGRFDSCPSVAAFCCDAVRALEPLLQPRALPFNRELRLAAANSSSPAEVKACGRPLMWSAVAQLQPGITGSIPLPPVNGTIRAAGGDTVEPPSEMDIDEEEVADAGEEAVHNATAAEPPPAGQSGRPGLPSHPPAHTDAAKPPGSCGAAVSPSCRSVFGSTAAAKDSTGPAEAARMPVPKAPYTNAMETVLADSATGQEDAAAQQKVRTSKHEEVPAVRTHGAESAALGHPPLASWQQQELTANQPAAAGKALKAPLAEPDGVDDDDDENGEDGDSLPEIDSGDDDDEEEESDGGEAD